MAESILQHGQLGCLAGIHLLSYIALKMQEK
jgi:hypothetical protein